MVLHRAVLGAADSLLTGTAAAGGIALINSIGNLGGQAGPVLMSSLASPSGGLAPGLVALAGVAILCGILVLAVPIRPAAGTAAGLTARAASDPD